MLKFRGKSVYLACGGTDMRKSVNGLAELVELSFGIDNMSGEAVFVFCNRDRDRLKILEWDGDGYWLHCKRLERGRFNWPPKSGDKTLRLSGLELECLLEGTKLARKILRQEVTGRAAV